MTRQDAIDFIKDYQALRDQQKAYFRTRFTEDLNRCKKLEKDLDAKAKRLIDEEAERTQQKLF